MSAPLIFDKNIKNTSNNLRPLIMSAHKTAFLLAKKAELYPKQRYYNNNFKTNYIFAVIPIYIFPYLQLAVNI